jgi:hypothetical protein
MPHHPKPLWRCPKCGAEFVTRNMWHSCGKFTLDDLFTRSEPHVIKLFRKLAKMVRACGPVKMIPQKTRVIFMTRVRFAGAVPRKSFLLCSFALPRRLNHPRFIKVESYSPLFHGHTIRLESEKDLDDELQKWLYEAYTVGNQEPLLKKKS